MNPEAGERPPDPSPSVPYVPWPLPAAVGLALGICAAAALPTWVALATVLGLASGVAATVARRHGSCPTWLLVAVVAMAVGAARFALWRHAPDPVAPLLGREARWIGHSDGNVLRVLDPVRTRLALVPTGPVEEVPSGWVTVVGTAERADGKRNPGGFDYAGYLRRRGVTAELFVAGVVEARGRRSVRDRLLAGVREGLSEEAAALMAAMTLGVRDDLGALRDRFAAAGLAHVLALSGLHVGVLLAAIGRLLAALGRRRYPWLILITVGFVALVGPSPSVVRAAVMALAVLAGLASGAGRVAPWTALGLAATAGLLHAPQMLFDASFQLSYLAVGGMLAFLPPWLAVANGASDGPAPARRRPTVLPNRGRPVGSATDVIGPWARRARPVVVAGGAASVAAQLPSLSLVAGSFGSVPLASPLVNLLAVPLAGVLVPLGFLAGAAGLVASPLAWLVNRATSPLAEALLALAAVGERLPALAWGEVTWLGHACWAATVVALAAWAHGMLRPRHALTVALCAGVTTWTVPPAAAPPDVWFLDVGQGDAVVLRLPGGVHALIDGGGTPFSDFDVGARVVLPALRALGVHRLDVVVATHPDADHVEGLLAVLERMPVATLITGPSAPGVAFDERLRALARANGTRVHEARRGERIHLGRPSSDRAGGRAVLEVLNPGADAAERVVESPNETSVALALWLDGTPRAVFLGDLGVATEARLAVPPVEVLMVGHHGSRGSTSEALLRAARPRLAVISVGRNRYGHPHPSVVERLRSAGVTVRTTLEHGAVRVPLGPRGGGVTVAVEGAPDPW